MQVDHSFQHQRNIIGIFAQHKVAANLLMLIMLLVGVWALSSMNTQFFPNFALDYINVKVVWQGSTAEDVETAITRPMEQQFRSLNYVRKMTSTSANGVASITLEYEEGSDMGVALDEVKEQVSLLRNLPERALEPEVTRIVRYDLIARLLITGDVERDELRHFAHRVEDALLAEGINKIDKVGLPEEEIAIQVPTHTLDALGLTLKQISEQVHKFSRDIPAGVVGQHDVSRQLRSLEQRRDALAFGDLPIIASSTGELIRLEDIATVERRPQQGEVTVTYQGKPAIELTLQRTENSDALKSAKILQTWLDENKTNLPKGIELHVYDEAWQLIDERISLLLVNGLGGLALVVLILFIFLNGRVAFWVAAGIPISLMAMLAILYSIGGSINMISLFAMIMALGVIVDDAIVVGEDAFAHFQTGENSLLAAEGGAQRMLPPVIASSLTTISAFLPLMLIGGPIGNILFDIPVVMICVILASLVECFLVLPGHLRHSFQKLHKEKKTSRVRQKLESGFNHFRDNIFRPFIAVIVDYRWSALAGTISLFMLTLGLLVGGKVSFVFFPSPEGTILYSNVSFVSGTPIERVNAFLDQLEHTAYETDKEFGGDVVKLVSVLHGSTMTMGGGGGRSNTGDQFGALILELSSPDSRDVRNDAFIRAWKKRVAPSAGLETFTITERKGGPPGQDIEILLNGASPAQVKAAALELGDILKTIKGVSGIEDDMPYGQEQWIYSLTPQGIALGLTIESVGQQLRSAFDGELVQIFQDFDDEIEVRVLLPDSERKYLANLESLRLQLPTGERVPFSTVVSVSTQRGFETIRHNEGQLAVQVYANVDKSLNNSNKVLAQLDEQVLPDLSARHGVQFSYEGRAADQKETMQDMLRGMIFALAMMYIVLAWQFASYGWPLIVMSIIPFGLIGALFGHFIMDIDVTLLSLFGFFGLSGIVVNDSIVLVTFYRHLREKGMKIREALIEASCQRLRAVLLTSLTTIFGLLPLLFETSLQAQFLIPMATSIAFGLMFATVLVLLVVPALLGIYEHFLYPKSEWNEHDSTVSDDSYLVSQKV